MRRLLWILVSLFSSQTALSAGNEDLGFCGDLNDDGVTDRIIVQDKYTCGNAGCEYRLFLSRPDGEFISHDVGLHPLAVSLERSFREGNYLWGYWRSSAFEGGLFKIRLDETFAFESISLHMNDGFGTAIYNEVFSLGNRLKFKPKEELNCIP